MLKAVFTEGVDEISVSGLTQWDIGQKLEINLNDLPTNFQVHFAPYRRSEIAYIVEATSSDSVAVVSIPNIILQVASKSACAWIYIPSDDGHETIKTIVLPIVERARPADYVYEEEEILTFEKVIYRAESAATKAEEARLQCNQAQSKIEGFEEYNRNNYSNSLKAHASGEVVRVDDVSPAQHNVKAKVRGKNLLKPVENKELFGIKMTVGDDGGYTFNGTATGGHFSFSYDLDLEPGTYAIAAHNSIGMGSSGADAPYMALRSATSEWLASRAFTTKDAQIIFTTNEKIKSFLFAIPEGVTVENYTIYLQLEEGNTITEYEPYIDPSSVKVTRCGKSIFAKESQVVSGVEKPWTSLLVAAVKVPPGDYVASCNFKQRGQDTSKVSISVRSYDDYTVTFGDASSEEVNGYLEKQFTVPNGENGFQIFLYSNQPNEALTTECLFENICVEYGTKATGYSAYNGTTYTPNADGTVDGILSVAPTMTIYTDTEGANLEVEYNQDINVVTETTIRNVAFGNGATITLAHNTCFYATEPISNLTIIYPTGNYISNIEFTLADSGDITITLPESKYIGSTPSFANGEAWELSIKNGVVVGGR